VAQYRFFLWVIMDKTAVVVSELFAFQVRFYRGGVSFLVRIDEPETMIFVIPLGFGKGAMLGNNVA
jgi:hypothetical protein